MRKLSELLRELENIGRRRNKNVDVHVVIDDHKSDDEPVVTTCSLSEELLARQSNQGATKAVLHNGIMSAISKWRDKR